MMSNLLLYKKIINIFFEKKFIFAFGFIGDGCPSCIIKSRINGKIFFDYDHIITFNSSAVELYHMLRLNTYTTYGYFIPHLFPDLIEADTFPSICYRDMFLFLAKNNIRNPSPIIQDIIENHERY